MSEMEQTLREPSPTVDSRSSSDSDSSGRPHTPPTPDGVLASSLPYPDFDSLKYPYDPKKKSHARRQPAGHVPRPKNAFILFRCDFVRQKKVPDHVEANHRNISRIVGNVWRQMSDKQKAPWVEMAEIEKKNHTRAYPGYKYHPGSEPRGGGIQKPKKKNASVDDEDARSLFSSPWALTPPLTPPIQSPIIPQRRSSSCPPPGAVPVTSSLDMLHFDGQDVSMPLVARDDLSRRPSCTTMYHSVPLPTPPPAQPQPQPPTPEQVSWTFPWPTEPSSGPMLTSGPYSIAPPIDAPGWDAPPPKPSPLYSFADNTMQTLGGFFTGAYDYNGSLLHGIPEWTNFGTRGTTHFPFTNSFDESESSTVTSPNIWTYNPSPLEPAKANSPSPSAMALDSPIQSFFPQSHTSTRNFDRGMSSSVPLPPDSSMDYAYSTRTQMRLNLTPQAHSDAVQELGILFPRLSLVDNNRNFTRRTENPGGSSFTFSNLDGEGHSDGPGTSSESKSFGSEQYQNHVATYMHRYFGDSSSLSQASGSRRNDGYRLPRVATPFPREGGFTGWCSSTSEARK